MKPFHQGQRDFKYPKFRKTKKGYILEGNPYKENTKDYRDYEFGYKKAYYANLDKLGEGS